MDWLREIDNARRYAKVLDGLLRRTEQHEPIDADAIWEEIVRADKRRLIVCRMAMPPPIQALHTEQWALLDEIVLLKKQDASVSDLETRVRAVRECMISWTRDRLLAWNSVREYLRGRKFILGVGAGWHMLVVEELPHAHIGT